MRILQIFCIIGCVSSLLNIAVLVWPLNPFAAMAAVLFHVVALKEIAFWEVP